MGRIRARRGFAADVVSCGLGWVASYGGTRLTSVAATPSGRSSMVVVVVVWVFDLVALERARMG